MVRRIGLDHAVELLQRYARHRAELKELIRHPGTSPEERSAAQRELRAQPRDAGATRVRDRDAVDGRPRGHLRAFGLSRVRMRTEAHAGHLPGVRKASCEERCGAD
ncbi:30S ribosomal protein S14 [Streptomyces sp. NPDC005336]|uniref:30S ribosomal protein S14 n=1 Tax=unclassified Streptomyces TaxID=2593676 RepID=UPI0033BB5017